MTAAAAGASYGASRYGRAVRIFDRVLAIFPGEAWTRPSPCADWSALALGAHVVWGVRLLGSLARGEPWPATLPTPEDLPRLTPDGVLPAWQQAVPGTVAAITDEASQLIVTAPVGQMPLGELVHIFGTTELVVHAWDLAQVAQLPPEIDEVLARELFDVLSPMDAGLRQPHLYGPAQQAADGAPYSERLMAFLGRRPLS
jgi:uncharacterized protein (TIGR03086 family)